MAAAGCCAAHDVETSLVGPADLLLGGARGDVEGGIGVEVGGRGARGEHQVLRGGAEEGLEEEEEEEEEEQAAGWCHVCRHDDVVVYRGA